MDAACLVSGWVAEDGAHSVHADHNRSANCPLLRVQPLISDTVRTPEMETVPQTAPEQIL